MTREEYEKCYVEEIKWQREIGLNIQKQSYKGVLSHEGVEKMAALIDEEFEQEVELLKDVPHYPFNHEKSKERHDLHMKYNKLKWQVYCQYKLREN